MSSGMTMPCMTLATAGGSGAIVPGHSPLRAEEVNHAVHQRPADVEHDVLNATDSPLTFIEIEVKRPEALVQLARPQS
jgi:hypothetical protein